MNLIRLALNLRQQLLSPELKHIKISKNYARIRELSANLMILIG